MKNYYKIMLGSKSKHAEKCLNGNFIGADYGINQDLSNDLAKDWKEFNHKYKLIYLEKNPNKSKIAAGSACGALWTVCKGISKGDVVLCPNGHGKFLVGEVISDYYYEPSDVLPHRRKVAWYPITITRSEVSSELKGSTNSQGTSSMISKHATEIESFIKATSSETTFEIENSIEDSAVFGLEKHLEEFLVHNWINTELGKKYDLFIEDGEIVGQQYPTDTGPIDILAISKDKKELLVIELKKGRASDVVIGQIQRYMGYVLEELAEEDQTVKGVIIAFENDQKMRRALAVTKNIDFYRYQVSFKLFKD